MKAWMRPRSMIFHGPEASATLFGPMSGVPSRAGGSYWALECSLASIYTIGG